MWSVVTPSGNVSLPVLSAPSSSLGPCASLHLIRYDKLPGPPLTQQSQATGRVAPEPHASCSTLAIKVGDPLDCKHITLKTASEKTQQMSNLRVDYHYVPLMSLLTALWLWAGAAVFVFWGSLNSPIGFMPHHQTIIINRLWVTTTPSQLIRGYISPLCTSSPLCREELCFKCIRKCRRLPAGDSPDSCHPVFPLLTSRGSDVSLSVRLSPAACWCCWSYPSYSWWHMNKPKKDKIGINWFEVMLKKNRFGQLESMTLNGILNRLPSRFPEWICRFLLQFKYLHARLGRKSCLNKPPEQLQCLNVTSQGINFFTVPKYNIPLLVFSWS